MGYLVNKKRHFIITGEKNKRVLSKLKKALTGINENEMLEAAIVIWERLYDLIQSLPADTQYKIIFESTMIAYDARIAAFEHINNYTPEQNKLDENIN